MQTPTQRDHCWDLLTQQQCRAGADPASKGAGLENSMKTNTLSHCRRKHRGFTPQSQLYKTCTARPGLDDLGASATQSMISLPALK